MLGEFFATQHSPEPYYLCGLTWYMFEKYLREEKIAADAELTKRTSF